MEVFLLALPLVEIGYWLDTAADLTDPIHHTMTRVSNRDEDRQPIKLPV